MAALEPPVALLALWDAGRAAWPDIDLPSEVFVRRAREHTPVSAGTPRTPELDPARASDWYLACACAEGDPAAIAAFDARFFPGLDPALRRLKLDASALEEAKQRLRHELFVSEPGRPPRIASYAGRGDLGGWLRVTAVRSALKLLRRSRRDAPLDEEELLARVPVTAGDDPDLLYMKELYRPAFKAAFQEALESLSSREQNLLRQQVLDGLTSDQLGALYHVHRATAARWVEGARELLIRRTRTAFQRRIRIGNEECDSIMRMIQSQLDVTIRRRLAGP